MASQASTLFDSLANVWRQLVLRSDVDDIVLELLGRFSLERLYASSADREAYQHLVISLLVQLKAIFDLQRLTIPAEREHSHLSWYLGFLVSWEVALRSVEFVLQIIIDSRESLWAHRELRDRYLAEFLLSALRVLTLHPKAPTNQRSKDRRERFARIHGAIEQVYDSYPGPKSFLLEVCKEVAGQLHADPNSLGLPAPLKSELPNVTKELYPLPPCLHSSSISELVPASGFGNWLVQFLALRDVSQFVVAAWIQYHVNREMRDVRLHASSARARNAVLSALNNLRLPPNLTKVDMVITFSTTFRIILPDTLDLARHNAPGPRIDECELDALDALSNRLRERQVVYRISDREIAHSLSQVIANIALQDDPSGRYTPGTRPSLYALNCPSCHLVGASQLRSSGIQVPMSTPDSPEIRLPPQSRCLYCGEGVTLAREVTIARQTWELIEPLRPDADTINVERHLRPPFQMWPPKLDPSGMVVPPTTSSGIVTSGYEMVNGPLSSLNPPGTQILASPAVDQPGSRNAGVVSPDSPTVPHASPIPIQTVPFHPDISTGSGKRTQEETDLSHVNGEATMSSDPLSSSGGSAGVQRPVDAEQPRSPPTPQTSPVTPGQEKNRFAGFLSKLRPSNSNTSPGDSSSSSSGSLEAQKQELISLGSLLSAQRQTRVRPSKNISVALSQTSALALFWTQFAIQVWDVGTSPPRPVRTITPESTCLLATVAKEHLAYIVGNRDQKLTLRIINLVQPTVPAVEYRIPSSLWCRSIAIDKRENYVVVGFENATVRFFNARTAEQPREDRLHAAYHPECKSCPSVDTLSFSNDGLVLLASTRNKKDGTIQIWCWRFPFHVFHELYNCRYTVRLHESEDNGVSSAVFRSGVNGEDDLVCITTWTQSGYPILIQPRDGHRTEVRKDQSGRSSSRLGSRIQCAVFSPSGRELVMVNDKGCVFQVSNLNSSPLDVRKISTTKELTAKTDSFALSFMNISDDEYIVLAWTDSKEKGWIKKIPVSSRNESNTPGFVYEASTFSEPRDAFAPPNEPVELENTERRPEEIYRRLQGSNLRTNR